MTDVVVLVEPAGTAAEVTRALVACRVDPQSRVLQPPDPLLGAGIVTQPRAAVWWAEQGIGDLAVVVCRHAPALLEQLGADLVATWVVWCEDAEQAAGCRAVHVVGIVAPSPEEFAAELVASVLEPAGCFRPRPPRMEWGPFARRAATSPPPPPPRPPSLPAGADPPPATATAGSLADGPGTATERSAEEKEPVQAASFPPVRLPPPTPAPSAPIRWPELPSSGGAVALPLPAPIAALSQSAGAPDGRGAHAARPRAVQEGGRSRGRMSEPRPRPLGLGGWVRQVVARDAGLGVRLGEVGSRLEGRHSTTVGIATTKGGTTKTTLAAALGWVGDMALAPRGGAVCVVEANPDNADVAIDFAVPPEAPTVRELIACLESGGAAPRPHVVEGTRIEVWPGPRQSAGHGQAQIARLHAYLQAQYSLVIADFSNCLPDAVGGAAPELLHAWAPWVDVWVVPMDCSQKALIAAGESIDALTACVRGSAGAREPGFVVPLLLNDPGARRDRRHRSLVDEFRSRGIAVVEIPYVPQVGRAAMNGQRPTEIHRGLTRAWMALLEEVAAVAVETIPR